MPRRRRHRTLLCAALLPAVASDAVAPDVCEETSEVSGMTCSEMRAMVGEALDCSQLYSIGYTCCPSCDACGQDGTLCTPAAETSEHAPDVALGPQQGADLTGVDGDLGSGAFEPDSSEPSPTMPTVEASPPPAVPSAGPLVAAPPPLSVEVSPPPAATVGPFRPATGSAAAPPPAAIDASPPLLPPPVPSPPLEPSAPPPWTALSPSPPPPAVQLASLPPPGAAPAPPSEAAVLAAGFRLIRRDARCCAHDQSSACSNGDAASLMVSHASDPAACAEECRSNGGCHYFSFGSQQKQGQCWFEHTETADCYGQGLQTAPAFDFYELVSATEPPAVRAAPPPAVHAAPPPAAQPEPSTSTGQGFAASPPPAMTQTQAPPPAVAEALPPAVAQPMPSEGSSTAAPPPAAAPTPAGALVSPPPAAAAPPTETGAGVPSAADEGEGGGPSDQQGGAVADGESDAGGLASLMHLSEWPTPVRDAIRGIDLLPPPELLAAVPMLPEAVAWARPLQLPLLALVLLLLLCCCCCCICRRCICGRRRSATDPYSFNEYSVNIRTSGEGGWEVASSELVEMADVMVDAPPAPEKAKPVRAGSATKVCSYEELHENNFSDCSAESADFEGLFDPPASVRGATNARGAHGSRCDPAAVPAPPHVARAILHSAWPQQPAASPQPRWQPFGGSGSPSRRPGRAIEKHSLLTEADLLSDVLVS